MRRVLILGSTGSIGTQALDVIRANPRRFEVVGLAAGTDRAQLEAQAAEFQVDDTALALRRQIPRAVDRAAVRRRGRDSHRDGRRHGDRRRGRY